MSLLNDVDKIFNIASAKEGKEQGIKQIKDFKADYKKPGTIKRKLYLYLNTC